MTSALTEVLEKLEPCPMCGGEAHLERQGHVACKTGWPCVHTAYFNWGTPEEQNAAAIRAWNTRPALLASQQYAEANPLGGPASMLETAARRIRAGEDFHEVLADYDLHSGAALLRDAGDGWLPIESAPRDGERIILGRPDIDGEGGISVAGYWLEELEDGVDYMGNDGGFTDVDFQVFQPGRSFGAESYRYAGSQPTHWRPLPAPPTEGN